MLLSLLNLFLRNCDCILAKFIIAYSIKNFICQPQRQHFLLVLMQVFCKLDYMFALCPSVTSLYLAEHRRINL